MRQKKQRRALPPVSQTERFVPFLIPKVRETILIGPIFCGRVNNRHFEGQQLR